MRDKPIPSMAFRYYLEKDRFVERVFAKAYVGAYGPHSYDELLKVARHRAYALEVEHRLFALVERFKSLYFVDALLSFREFPFYTPGGVLSREQWVRIACDVMLARLTSIRDCVFLLVEAVYQLGMEPREVTLRSLMSRPLPDQLRTVLREIAMSARSTRDHRDRHLHRGEERPLFDPHAVYKSASLSELYRPAGPNEVDLGDGRITDLHAIHDEVVQGILDEYHRAADELFTATKKVFELIERPYLSQWHTYRDIPDQEVAPSEHDS
jgi:hypothetical protein